MRAITRTLTGSIAALSAVCALAALPAAAATQGVGATGAQVLQFVAGSRAAAFSGAYTAASGDVDALFYNAAGVATLQHGAALSYEAYVEDITLASFGGVLNLGRFSVGLAGLFLDAGEIDEILPDPEFGGNRGQLSDRTISASELVARLSVATPLGERLRLGASAGVISSSIAEQTRSAPFFDFGAQYDLNLATIGVALRNIGTALSSSTLSDASLPAEGRLGAALHLVRADGLGLTLQTDLVARLNEGSTGLLFGAEAGWQANTQRAIGAVARAGYRAADGDAGLGTLTFGAGLSMNHVAVDYTYQNLEFFGAVHRIGVRWNIVR